MQTRAQRTRVSFITGPVLIRRCSVYALDEKGASVMRKRLQQAIGLFLLLTVWCSVVVTPGVLCFI